MKRIIAVLLVIIMVALTFSACSDNVITDKEGNTHVALKEFGGDYKQDKFGNLIEEVTDNDGKKVTQPFTYPEMIESGKNEIQNAYFKIDVPEGWTYDENLKVFRIQHEGDTSESNKAMCEVQFNSSSTGDIEVIYDNAYASELALQLINSSLVTDIKEYETKLFDKEVKAYSCKYSTGSTAYFYAFTHAYVALSIKFIVSDVCADEINPEEFISENIKLKIFEEE